jgi:hypothetical protein
LLRGNGRERRIDGSWSGFLDLNLDFRTWFRTSVSGPRFRDLDWQTSELIKKMAQF